jgi:glycerophosphoryl diester phosphodiesterase
MYDDVLERLRGRKALHLDLKFASPREFYEPSSKGCHELVAVQRAVDVLGADAVVVTTGTDHAVAAIRRWSAEVCPDLMVGLSLGKSRAGLPWREQLEGRLSELFPARRVAASDANVVVANHWLAFLGVARWTARRGLPLVVWTVDGRRGLLRWLRDPRVWIVTTNQATLAARLRSGGAPRLRG